MASDNNIKKSIEKINTDFVGLLKAEVRVKTGALQRSIRGIVNNNLTSVEMLRYGDKDSVWKDYINPPKRYNLVSKKIKVELEDGIKKDIDEVIKKENKLK